MWELEKDEKEIWTLQAGAVRHAFATLVEQRCRSCTVTHRPSQRYGLTEYKVEYPNGFSFKITLDPGVIEIVAGPHSLKGFERNYARLQQDIFQIAKDLGLQAYQDEWGGSGHVHIGVVSAFGQNALLFRNFLVDLVNHSELATGILEYDFKNAPPLAALPLSKRKEFIQVIADFDEGKFSTIEELAMEFLARVFIGEKKGSEAHDATKYHAFSLGRILRYSDKSQWTLEIRSIRAERNPDELLKILRLFENRIEKLKTMIGPIKLLPIRILSIAERVQHFYEFVRESGLPWKQYRALVPQYYLTRWQDSRCRRLLSSPIHL